MWVPYINNKKQDWDLIVQNDVKIFSHDRILWKFELNQK